MSIRIKCVIIVVLILGLLKILGLIKKNKLELKYALSWLFLELGIFIITLIPNLLNVISKALGIYNEINMLFFLGFVFIILVIFSLTMSLSRNSERVRKMAQEIALNSYYNNKKNGGGKDVYVFFFCFPFFSYFFFNIFLVNFSTLRSIKICMGRAIAISIIIAIIMLINGLIGPPPITYTILCCIGNPMRYMQ